MIGVECVIKSLARDDFAAWGRIHQKRFSTPITKTMRST